MKNEFRPGALVRFQMQDGAVGRILSLTDDDQPIVLVEGQKWRVHAADLTLCKLGELPCAGRVRGFRLDNGDSEEKN